MAERSLELTIISAKDLNKAKYLIGKMDVYAVVYIYGAWNHDQKQKTHVHKGGESNPVWNYPMRFMIDESAALQNRLTLVVKIKTGGLFGDTDVGAVYVPVKELLEGGDSSGNRPVEFVSYQVRTPSGKLKGELNFSYKFGEISTGEPVTAYPAVGSESSSAYPPPVYAAPVGAAALGSDPPAPAGAAPGAYPPGGVKKLILN
ncbi:putative C2 domain-containing protein [Helianthus annuus]|nr:putative C2 domain-containing protein [Helianthus annuus]